MRAKNKYWRLQYFLGETVVVLMPNAVYGRWKQLFLYITDVWRLFHWRLKSFGTTDFLKSTSQLIKLTKHGVFEFVWKLNLTFANRRMLLTKAGGDGQHRQFWHKRSAISATNKSDVSHKDLRSVVEINYAILGVSLK